jgi:acetate kinase
VLWLVRQGIDPEELHDALERRSGLLALAGTGDMRELLERGDPHARDALAVYLHRLAGAVAAMAVAAGGLDALVFTGGVGEHAPEVRAAAADGLGFLGVALDADANARATADAEIGVAGAAARTLVVTAREDLEVARQVRALLP